jgi:RNA polymerase sigma factor (sigma-70 family)
MKKIVNKVIFKDMLEVLSYREREIIDLYYWKGLKEREIADKFGVTHQMINRVKLRAIKKMYKQLET